MPPSRLSLPASPKIWSWPCPPMNRSSLLPPHIRSSPSLPDSVSLPLSPCSLSCPVPPATQSLPSPPQISSLPSPPLMASLPPLPRIVSCPPSPRMQSAPDVPVRVSLLLVPLMMLLPAGQHDTSSPRSVVTVVVLVAMLPAGSLAVQVTIVIPSGNFAGALLVTVTDPQSSTAFAVPRFRPAATVHSVLLIAAGGEVVNTGGTVSASFECGVDMLPATSSPQNSTAEQIPASVSVPEGAVTKVDVVLLVPWTTWRPRTPEPGVG